MKIHFSYRNFIKEQCRPRLEEYANEEKLKSLTLLLKERDFALANLDIHVEHLPRHNAFSIKLNLKIAKHILFVKEVKHNLAQAFDLALGKLIAQVRRLKSIKDKSPKKSN